MGPLTSAVTPTSHDQNTHGPEVRAWRFWMLAVGLVAIGIWIFAVSGLWVLPVILFERLFNSWWGLLIVAISLKATGII